LRPAGDPPVDPRQPDRIEASARGRGRDPRSTWRSSRGTRGVSLPGGAIRERSCRPGHAVTRLRGDRENRTGAPGGAA
jgi:hypothetical protein